jgi:hypothetical protein
MRKVLYVLGAVFLTLLVGGGGGIGYLAYVGNQLDREAKAYVDAAVPAIAANWSADELMRRAGPKLLKIKPDDVRTAFALFAKLGPLIQYKGSKGDATIFASVGGNGQSITAKYLAEATFKDGDASIDIELDKLEGAWKIRGFRVNSTAMMEKAVGRGT